jgi:hypothetical protein
VVTKSGRGIRYVYHRGVRVHVHCMATSIKLSTCTLIILVNFYVAPHTHIKYVRAYTLYVTANFYYPRPVNPRFFVNSVRRSMT